MEPTPIAYDKNRELILDYYRTEPASSRKIAGKVKSSKKGNICFSYSEGAEVLLSEPNDALKWTSVVSRYCKFLLSGAPTATKELDTIFQSDFKEDSWRQTYGLCFGAEDEEPYDTAGEWKQDFNDWFSGEQEHFEKALDRVVREISGDLDLFEHDIDYWDHKRGFNTIILEIRVPVSELLEYGVSYQGALVGFKGKASGTKFVL